MRFFVTLLACVTAVPLGCNGPTTSAQGTRMADYFPFNGTRTWTFVNDDANIPYQIVATLNTTPQLLGPDKSEAYTVDFSTHCINSSGGCQDGIYSIHDWTWSGDGTGVKLWSYTDDNGAVTFDPPITVFNEYGKSVDAPIVTTEKDGSAWTSTYVDLEPCNVKWTNTWGQCLHFSLDETGGTSPLTGDYWAVVTYNVVAFQLAGDDQRWSLLNAQYTSS